MLEVKDLFAGYGDCAASSVTAKGSVTARGSGDVIRNINFKVNKGEENEWE